MREVARKTDLDTRGHAGARENHRLAALPAADYRRLEPVLETVSVSPGAVLYESGTPCTHVMFPADSIISLINVLRDGFFAEIAVVGSERVVGVPLVPGNQKSSSRVAAQGSGTAYRIRVGRFVQELERSARFKWLTLRVAQGLITHIAQTSVCNQFHLIEQQLCRWLLLMLDRSSTNEICVKLEMIAGMLGVRRDGVTAGACSLRATGAIEYRRGHVVVRDRPSLEAQVCESYAVVGREYDRLLSPHIAG